MSSLLVPLSRPPLWCGVVVAAALIAVETVVVVLLKHVAPTMAFGVVFLLGVLVVATNWGFGLATITAIFSALAFNLCRTWPHPRLGLTQLQDWVVFAVFFIVALLCNALAGLARARAVEADQRRREADLAAELARRMLRAGDLHSALDSAAECLALLFQLPWAQFELESVPADDDRCAFALRDGATAIGTLLVPSDLPSSMLQRLQDRVVPSLEELVAAVRQREGINTELQASREQLAQFFDITSDLMGIARLRPGDSDADTAGEHRVMFTRVNGAFERALGYSSDEIRSRPFDEFIHPDDVRRWRPEVVDHLRRPGDVIRTELRCIRSDGSQRWLEWNIVAGQSLLYVAGRDVTERRREQDRLVEAHRIVAESRDRLSVLARQQTALRRVATLVARSVAPSEVFSAVVAELASCLDVQNASLWRYEPDGTAVLLAAADEPGLKKMQVGERFSLDGENIAAMVRRHGEVARMDSHDHAVGPAAAHIRELGLRSGIGAPVVVDNRVWGAAIAGSSRSDAFPPDAEQRVSDFADLIATAIANAQARTELTASRARIVAAADDTRRRIERDLHDGAQQRLVSLGLTLRLAENAVTPEHIALKTQLSDVVEGLVGVSDELREISRGIHPAILSKGGLGPALKTLARRSAVPIKLDVGVDRRLPEYAEVAGYYVVAEALTNAAKHARASEVNVAVKADDDNLCLSVCDDGVGGADIGKGSGLIGLVDRVEAVGGQIDITSHIGDGTSLVVRIPLGGDGSPCSQSGEPVT